MIVGIVEVTLGTNRSSQCEQNVGPYPSCQFWKGTVFLRRDMIFVLGYLKWSTIEACS